ncbi:hypothetical protein T265_11447 [Opisthorchis viverrini]|uniref:Uncharacterized protein n=1 Tax=Opisthorchis viverrini TaxID=6198 RepID=A0A074YYY7_OPIVI|nr:hypothetical protein T265_11447 [Opisthorchis viverrini]KER19883.1 hypothetical protein T265_11447 [Opisthorchis viverrini]
MKCGIMVKPRGIYGLRRHPNDKATGEGVECYGILFKSNIGLQRARPDSPPILFDGIHIEVQSVHFALRRPTVVVQICVGVRRFDPLADISYSVVAYF